VNCEYVGDASDRPAADMWNVWLPLLPPPPPPPPPAECDFVLLSAEDSTLGKGWRSPMSCEGGVRARASGEAV
jgi:hypothetical protein